MSTFSVVVGMTTSKRGDYGIEKGNSLLDMALGPMVGTTAMPMVQCSLWKSLPDGVGLAMSVFVRMETRCDACRGA